CAETTMPCSASAEAAAFAAIAHAIERKTAIKTRSTALPGSERVRWRFAGDNTPPSPRPLPAPTVGEGTSTRTGLMHGLIQPLVVKRPFERVQLLAKFPGMRGGNARVEGFAVAPSLKQREVVRAGVVLLQHVKPQIAVVLACRRG